MDRWVIIDTLIGVWIFAPLMGFGFYWGVRKQGKAHPMIRAMLITIIFETWLTLGLTFQRLSELGIIEKTLKSLLIGATSLLWAASLLLVRLVDKSENAREADK